jgi:hypothetical protein
MKEFRKNENGLFICEECNRTFISYQSLRNHIRHSHKNISQKLYYDKWRKTEMDDKCKICDDNACFISLFYGYKGGCCKKHINLYAYKKKSQKMKIKYGVENQFQRKDIKEKIKIINIKNFGVEYPSQSKEILLKGKKTKKEKYGNENYNNVEKRNKTNILKYGYNTILKDKQKMKDAIINKYGVENVMKLSNIFQKQQISGFLAKQYRKTNIYYRGSYEFDFLEKYYDIFSDIKNGPSIKYKYKYKNRTYHSDFYIPFLNLIVEIKSKYYYEKYKYKCLLKERAAINNGFIYIFIIDKKYDKFNERAHIPLLQLQVYL